MRLSGPSGWTVADDDSPDEHTLLGFVVAGRAWVAVDGTGTAVGYVMVEMLDGAVQIEQVSVHPDHAGRRLGSALIDHAAEWAAARGVESITLTTFAGVPWNAPYYARLGFRRISDHDVSPGLARQLDHESEYFEHRWPRVAMRRDA